SITSVDFIPDTDLSKITTAEQDNKDLPIRFIRKSNTEVSIIVDSIIRRNMDSHVVIDFDGSDVGIDNEEMLKVNIPSIDKFKVIDVRKGFYPKKYIDIVFSSPISEKQDINGLVGLFDTNNKLVKYSYTISGTVIKVYPKVNNDEYTVRVFRGLEDVLNKKIAIDYSKTLEFKQIIPYLSLVGKGNIMPDSVGLIFPFEAKGLKEVKVTIVRVFKNNMGQFLQDNNISSSSSLRKVGRPIYNSIVPLNMLDKEDYKVKKRYYIDLNKLIDVKEGEIYNVELTFRKRNIAFSCGDETDNIELSSIEENEAYWDGDSYSRDNYNYNYDYSQRNNPCHSYFYRAHNTKISRNLISSNYGIITKQNEDGTYNIIVSDLRTTLPVSNALVELYNYQ
ncbi:MAG: hypothetical protein KAH32_08055, partial [Chlamydiia bacterium]|nr:hypothetical protein [Chlamydiia bacterium]